MTPRQQVLAELDRQCRITEASKFFTDWKPTRPVIWGPVTSSIAKALGWTCARVRSHLNAEVTAGRVQRHMPYQSAVRWWLPAKHYAIIGKFTGLVIGCCTDEGKEQILRQSDTGELRPITEEEYLRISRR